MAPPTIRSDATLSPGDVSAPAGDEGAAEGGAVSCAEPEAPATSDRLGAAVESSASVGGGVGCGSGRGGAGDPVGAGSCVGTGVGAAVGGGGGGGGGVGCGVGGGAVTVTVGPSSGCGGSPALSAWNVTCQVPAGSVDVPCHVPSRAVPLTLVRGTVAFPIAAWTAWAGRGGSDEV
jgi:hypothetical protein